MMYALYDIILHAFFLAMLPYYAVKSVTAKKYREGVGERLGLVKEAKLSALCGGPVVWVHAVSVGETKAALPVIAALKKARPDIKVAFSTVTETGNRVAGSEGAALIDALMYFPFDFSWAASRAIRKIDPSVFVLIEKEIWPNVLRALAKRGVPVVVANGTMSERSFRRFRRFSFFFKDIFGSIAHYCARTEQDLKKARGCGVKEGRAELTGNIKFDLRGPAGTDASLDSLRGSLGIAPSDRVIVAGSTHAGEEDIILAAFKDLIKEVPEVRLVIAPRHPQRFNEAESAVRKTGLAYSKRSAAPVEGAQIMLLDTIGELMPVYAIADVAVVCGSFVPGIGGHNLLEPAFYSKPIVYGPYLTSYAGMADLLEAGGGGIRAGAKPQELRDILKRLLTDEKARVDTGAAAKKVVESNRGAVKKTVEVIERYLLKERF